MAEESVETITRLIVVERSARWIVWRISGWPASGVRFFPGKRFDPPRAGIIARTSVKRLGSSVSERIAREGMAPDTLPHPWPNSRGSAGMPHYPLEQKLYPGLS